MDDFFELTFYIHLSIITRSGTTEVLATHSGHSLYRGPHIDDYNEEIQEPINKMSKLFDSVVKHFDKDLTFYLTLTMVSPFMDRPLRRRIRWKDSDCLINLFKD